MSSTVHIVSDTAMRSAAILFLAYGLAILGAGIALLPLLDGKKKRWEFHEKLLLVLVGLSILIGILHETLTHIEGLEASARAEDTADDAEAAAAGAERVARLAARIAEQATLAAENAKQASDKAGESADRLGKLVGEVQATAAEVIRTAEPIEKIRCNSYDFI
jgi:hypothetical protein